MANYIGPPVFGPPVLPSYVPRAAPSPFPLPDYGRVIDQGPPRFPRRPISRYTARQRRAAILALAQFGHHRQYGQL